MSTTEALATVLARAAARRAKREKLPHFRCDRAARDWESEQTEEVTE